MCRSYYVAGQSGRHGLSLLGDCHAVNLYVLTHSKKCMKEKNWTVKGEYLYWEMKGDFSDRVTSKFRMSRAKPGQDKRTV